MARLRKFTCFSALILLLLSCLLCPVQAARVDKFIDTPPVIEDFDYSIAFIPDMQVISWWYRDNVHTIFDWILDNAETKKIEFVIGLGDMTEKSSYGEWWEVEENVDRLNGVIPYALVRGNHDNTLDLNYFFPKNETPYIEGTYNPWINNSWRTVRMGELDYLIMTLDYGADDDVLNWAATVIEAHPNHNVIIATHSYLFEDGTTLDAGDDCPPSLSGGYNNGDDMWEKLIKNHANITLVVCGHDHSDRIVYRQDQGIHGNTVTQMLIDAQNLDLEVDGGAGMIAIAYFSNGGKTVQIEYISTIRQQWFMAENQFSLEIDVIPAVAIEYPPSNYAMYLLIGLTLLFAAGTIVLFIARKRLMRRPIELVTPEGDLS